MRWLKNILSSSFKNKIGLKSKECPVFLFNQDFYNQAWGKEHFGYYICDKGIKYYYKEPVNWHFFFSLDSDGKNRKSTVLDKISFLKHEYLIDNLNNCHKVKKINLKFEALKVLSFEHQLLNGEFQEFITGNCDVGIHSNSILYFDSESKLYKRILLSATGYISLKNQSPCTSKLLSYFI